MVHPKFFKGVGEVIQDNRTAQELEGAIVKSFSSRNNAWGMVDITLPNVRSLITTDKHQTSLHERIIGLHAVDGSCSNQVFFGHLTSVWIGSYKNLKMLGKTSMLNLPTYKGGQKHQCLY